MSSRLFAETKTIIPLNAKVASGKSSVCTRLEVSIRRSAELPASTAAWATKAPPPTSGDRSASSSTDSRPSTSSVPCRKSAGPSTAIAPAAVTSERPARATTATSAAARPSRAMATWVVNRLARGTTASTSTPTQAVARTIRIGDSPEYEIAGAWTVSAARISVTRGLLRWNPHGRRRIGLPGVLHRPRHRGVDHVQNGLRIDAEEQDEGEQRGERPRLPPGEVAHRPQRDAGRRSVQRALHEQQDVERRQHHPGRRDDRVGRVAGEGPQQHQELADEGRHAGQRERGQADDEEDPG